MLGTLVVLYLFLGGCGAGVMFVTAAWSLAFHRTRTRTQEQTAAFGDLKARCYGIGFVMLCLAALCLLLDLGRPELAFLLFTRPTLSILSFGSFTLLASILVSGFLAVANLMYVPFVRAGARKAAEAACLAVSLCMMAYTGVYVGWIEAVALWNNAATPALFALSSLSAGVSTVFVIAPFVRDVTRLSGWMLLLHRVHLAVLVLELVMLAGFVAFGFSNPFARESLAILFDPSGLGPWFVVGLVGLGPVGSLGRRSVRHGDEAVGSRAAGGPAVHRGRAGAAILRCLVGDALKMRGCRRCTSWLSCTMRNG